MTLRDYCVGMLKIKDIRVNISAQWLAGWPMKWTTRVRVALGIYLLRGYTRRCFNNFSRYWAHTLN